MDFGPDDLFACGAEGGGVAGRVYLSPKKDYITWFMPGGRQRAYDIDAIVEDSDQAFVFRDLRGRKFRLVPLTVELYNDHVREPGQPKYGTPEEMLRAYVKGLS